MQSVPLPIFWYLHKHWRWFRKDSSFFKFVRSFRIESSTKPSYCNGLSMHVCGCISSYWLLLSSASIFSILLTLPCNAAVDLLFETLQFSAVLCPVCLVYRHSQVHCGERKLTVPNPDLKHSIIDNVIKGRTKEPPPMHEDSTGWSNVSRFPPSAAGPALIRHSPPLRARHSLADVYESRLLSRTLFHNDFEIFAAEADVV